MNIKNILSKIRCNGPLKLFLCMILSAICLTITEYFRSALWLAIIFFLFFPLTFFYRKCKEYILSYSSNLKRKELTKRFRKWQSIVSKNYLVDYDSILEKYLEIHNKLNYIESYTSPFELMSDLDKNLNN